jgi:hypothetical protein
MRMIGTLFHHLGVFNKFKNNNLVEYYYIKMEGKVSHLSTNEKKPLTTGHEVIPNELW